nr:unnamed protein product [Callosobruchus chinensis]
MWVRDWIAKRNEQRAYNQLMAELRSGDPDFYKNFLHIMSAIDFDHLLESISANIRKKDSLMRKPISPAKRFVVCVLRHFKIFMQQATRNQPTLFHAKDVVLQDGTCVDWNLHRNKFVSAQHCAHVSRERFTTMYIGNTCVLRKNVVQQMYPVESFL